MKIECLAEQPEHALKLQGGPGKAKGEAGKRHLTIRQGEMALCLKGGILDVLVPGFALATPA